MYRVARTAFYIPDALLTFYVTRAHARSLVRPSVRPSARALVAL